MTRSTSKTLRASILMTLAPLALLAACGDDEATTDAKAECPEVVIVERPALPMHNEPQEEARRAVPKPAASAQVDKTPAPSIKLPPIDAPVHEPEPMEEDALHSSLEVVESVMATHVAARAPGGVSEAFSTDAGVLWAWVKIKNRAAPSRVTMVWRHEGKVRSKIDLQVGISSGWRTWSRKSIGKKDAGQWTVDVVAPDGTRLDRMRFEVEAPRELGMKM
jgi:hypothetical protein